MDWNWFFSSVAQSAAAIVAIFGGFIVTKIINNQTEFQRKCGEIKECIRSCLRLVNQSETTGFPYVVKRSRQGGLHSVERRIYNDNPVHDAEHYYRTTDFSAYVDRHEIINAIEGLIDNFRKNPAKPLTQVGVIMPGAVNQFYADERNAAESINKYIIDVNSQSLLARTLAAEITNNPYSSALVSMAIVGIIFLFYAGVIYPLSFMPMSLNQEPSLSLSAFWDILFSLRGAIMSVISAIFTLIMLAFLVLNLRLKFDEQDIKDLNQYSEPSKYSEYFDRAKANAVFLNPQEK